MDFGAIRIFRPVFVAGVIELYRALSQKDSDGSSGLWEMGVPWT